MGNDVSVSASDFASSEVRTSKFGCYSVDYSIFQVSESNQKFVKSSHLNSSLVCFGLKSEDEAVSRECFRNALVLKSVRHPSILKFLDAIQQPWLAGIITELVSPLDDCLPELYPDEAVQGFHSICSALAFLHTKAQLSHNNVQQSSIYCTSQGHWKLANFELCRPFSQMSLEALKTVQKLLGDEHAVENEEAYQFSADRRDSFDLYCLGRTILSVCDFIDSSVTMSKQSSSGTVDQQRRHLDQLRNLAKNSLYAASPAGRSPARRLQRHAAFVSHGFTQLTEFLADFSLKSEDELRQFFFGLKTRLFELPEGLVARRLSRLLLGRLPLTHPMASTYLLPYLLRPYRGPTRPPNSDCLLSEAEFRRELVPYLAMVLRIRDLPVRCALLDHFPAYCHLMDWRRDGAHRSLIPELLIGLRDKHDQLVARSHLAVAALVPLAGYAALFGDKADAARQSLFTDAQPRRRLLGVAPTMESGDNSANADGDGSYVYGADSARAAPLLLRDLAVLSDRYKGPEEAAAAESQRQAAMVEAESARIIADRRRGKAKPSEDENSRCLATVAEEALASEASASASQMDENEDRNSWGDDWEDNDLESHLVNSADAGAAVDPTVDRLSVVSEVEVQQQQQPRVIKQQQQQYSTIGGLTVEALTIKPVLTAAGRQIDEFLAELEPCIPSSVASSVAMENKTAAVAVAAAAPSSSSLAVSIDVGDDNNDEGEDAWGLGDVDDDATDAEAVVGTPALNGGATDDQR